MSVLIRQSSGQARAQAKDLVAIGSRSAELAFMTSLTAVVVVLTGIPYAFGYITTPAGQHFMGIVLNVPDTTQYLSWARESVHSFFIEDKLTPEHGPAVYFNVFWLIIGRLASATGLGFAESAQLVRPLAGAAYILGIYWYACLIFPDRLRRWTSTLVAVVGGGLGWVLVIQKTLNHSADVAFPLDLYVTEPNTFLSVMAFPLQAIAGGLVVITLTLASLVFERHSVRLAAVAGISGLLLCVMHGYDLVVVYAVVCTVALLRALVETARIKPLLLAAIICGPSAPVALYNVYITSSSPIWRGALAQYGNAGVFTPPPLHLLLLLGLPLILTLGAIWPVLGTVRREGLRRVVASANTRHLVLGVWLTVGFFLLYLPTGYQIKMLVGWQIPLSIASTWVLCRTVRQLAQRLHRRQSTLVSLAATLLVIAVLPTNVYLLGWRFIDLQRHAYPYYLANDEVSALNWLADHSQPSDVVLSSLTIGQYIPELSGNNAFLAHWAMTLDYYSKRDAVDAFFNAATPDSFRRQLVHDYAIKYVYVGPAEKLVGTYDPAASTSLLCPLYTQGAVTLFATDCSTRSAENSDA